MSGLHIFIVAVVVLLAVAFWNWQRSGEQKRALEQGGFTITESLGGSPELVIDSGREELALVSAGGYERFRFSEFQSVRIGFDERPETESNYRIELSFSRNRELRVGYGSEWEADSALKKLLDIVKPQ